VPAETEVGEDPGAAGPDESREALAVFAGLRQIGVEIRRHRAILYNSIYRADDQLLVTQHLYGIPGEREPVLYLQSAGADGMTTTYIGAFERIWTESQNPYQ
jgi:hypothetical protein